LTYDQTNITSGTGKIRLDAVGVLTGLVMGTHSSRAGVTGLTTLTSNSTAQMPFT